MDVFADLRAGADCNPGIDHRAFINVGADIDVGRHQHRAAADVAAAPRNRWRDDAHAFCLEAGEVVVGKAAFDFVKVAGVAVFYGDVVMHAEGEQYGFFQPFVHLPAARGGFGDAHRAAFQRIQRFVDGGEQGRGGVGRGDVGATLKGVFDGLLQVHGRSFRDVWAAHYIGISAAMRRAGVCRHRG